MKRFAFISRHVPTESQHRLAAERGIQLKHVGDRDAFAVNSVEFTTYAGVIVVHPAMALRLLTPISFVGVFNNINRAPVGEPPRFEATELHLFRMVDNQICTVIGSI